MAASNMTNGVPDPSMWPEPLCLISTVDGHGLEVNPAALQALEKIRAPLVVVGIAGLFRTGKSYIMNLLATGNSQGFGLGSTIESKTKGVWIWCVRHPTKRNATLALLDTEGLGDPDKGSKNHDIWLFTLAVLLSSTLIYNSKGTIDNDALEKLHFVTEIADHVKVKASEEDDEDNDFDRFFPSFIWAVRDFTLTLEYEGNKISSDEYLEKALELRKGSSKKVSEYNLPRKCIRRYFPSRKCFTFPLPVTQSSMMSELDNLSVDSLNPEFRRTAEQFAQHIYQTSKPKVVFPTTQQITGSMFGGLATAYVNAIKEGAIPCVENAVLQTAEMENSKAISRSIALYNEMMSSALALPTATADELAMVHQNSNKEAVKLFIQSAIFDDNHEFEKVLIDNLGQEYIKWCARNDEASVRRCEGLFAELSNQLNDNISNGVYMVNGGYEQYSLDLKKVLDAYEKAERKGVKSTEVLHQYQQKMSHHGSSILAADQKISEEEKKREEERKRREESELAKAAAEEEKVLLQKRMEDAEETHRQNIQQLEEKLHEDLKREREEQEEILCTRLAEQEKLLKDGFKEEAEELKQDIERLKKEQKEAEEKANKGNFFTSILKPIAEGITSALLGRFTGPSIFSKKTKAPVPMDLD